LVADEVAPSLRWATAEVTRTEFRGDGGSVAPTGGGGQTAPTHPTDEEPF